ncbi:MAG: SatD family protein [Calditrichota bacterium]
MESENKQYIVVIGDISGSKQLTGRNRYKTQLFVKSAVVQINEEFQDKLEAPLTISKGDEFQGLLNDLETAFRIVLALEKLTAPVQLRFGIGIGKVYKMGGTLPIEMDGPAFHRASNALHMAKKRKHAYCILSDNPSRDMLTNTIFQLITAIRKRWNERHYRLFWSYKDLGTYREVAERENVTPQAVCDTLKNSRAIDVKNAEENLLEYFRKNPVQIHPSESMSSPLEERNVAL